MKKAEMLIVFYLLQDKANVGKNYREIAAATDTSIGSVHTAMAELSKRGYVIETERGRILRKRMSLVDRWAKDYSETLRDKLMLSRFTFLAPQVKNSWQDIVLPKTLNWGGEPAAALLTHCLQPGHWVIYTSDNANSLIATGRMIPDSKGEICVYKKFWQGQGIPLLVVYADLIASENDRCSEAAELIKPLI